MLNLIRACASIMLLLCCGSLFAAEQREPSVMLLGGTEISVSNSYSYLGVIMANEGSTLRQGWATSVFANWLNYSYTTGAAPQVTTVRTDVPGVRAGLGYRWQGEQSSIGLTGNVGYQYTSQQPAPVTGQIGGEPIIMPQVDALYHFTPDWDASLMANYVFGQNSFWSLLRVGWSPMWRLHFGPEFGLQGGANYLIQKVGVYAATPVADGLTLEFNAGTKYYLDLTSESYIGVAFSKNL